MGTDDDSGRLLHSKHVLSAVSGHFTLTNQASKNVLQIPPNSNYQGADARTSPYGGADNQERDLNAVP